MAGVMTFGEMSSELLWELGSDTETDAYRNDWINRAYITLTTQTEFFGKKIPMYFPELETFSTDTTADGTATVATPSDAHFVHTLWDSSSDTKMINVSWRDYVGFTGRAAESSRSAPTMWVKYGTNLYLYPTPDGSYGVTIYYKKHITKLSAAGDVTAIGREWDEPLLKLSVIQSLQRLKRYDDTEKEIELFLGMVAGAASAYTNEAADREDRRYPDGTWMHNEY